MSKLQAQGFSPGGTSNQKRIALKGAKDPEDLLSVTTQVLSPISKTSALIERPKWLICASLNEFDFARARGLGEEWLKRVVEAQDQEPGS